MLQLSIAAGLAAVGFVLSRFLVGKDPPNVHCQCACASPGAQSGFPLVFWGLLGVQLLTLGLLGFLIWTIRQQPRDSVVHGCPIAAPSLPLNPFPSAPAIAPPLEPVPADEQAVPVRLRKIPIRKGLGVQGV